jgi:hypothetical protein
MLISQRSNTCARIWCPSRSGIAYEFASPAQQPVSISRHCHNEFYNTLANKEWEKGYKSPFEIFLCGTNPDCLYCFWDRTQRSLENWSQLRVLYGNSEHVRRERGNASASDVIPLPRVTWVVSEFAPIESEVLQWRH